ncbi:hypothetical protein AMATHDRAFT_9478 [Amanita thiersii Skay4041]|uniref:Uncharacterized protein n=1 Tax=Amanita thiersii Skay4041 TaxID=703135 RepID=A0A2A9N7C8_9AGAR|nr:hypothetical protein AMATHDRAFT_9478 [Amanita thiersii Skay4041]
MLAALRKVKIFCLNQLDQEAGGDILQEVLQEQSGSDGLNEPISGGFQNWNLEVVVGVNIEGRHTSGLVL